MSLSWTKGKNEPVSHLEDLIHEMIEDSKTYYIEVNEQRVNGQIFSILMRAGIEENQE